MVYEPIIAFEAEEVSGIGAEDQPQGHSKFVVEVCGFEKLARLLSG